MNLEDSQCVFCAKLNGATELIEMATNSLVIDDEVLEFSDLIRSLLFLKVCLHFVLLEIVIELMQLLIISASKRKHIVHM